MDKKIPVLMYHSIQGRNSFGTGCDYEIKEEDFENQIRFLVENGYKSILFEDFISSREMPEKGIVITFDDGHLSNYAIAFPILLKFSFRAEFFITSEQISDSNRMNVHQLLEMIDNGMSIGSHGLTHTYLDDLSTMEAKKEIQQSRESLSKMIGRSVDTFSAPGGRFRDQHVQIAVNCGYNVFCTSRPGLISPQTSLLNIPRMPICRGNVSDFSKIVNGASYFYLKKRIFARLLCLSKKILGNKRYEIFRSFIMQR